MRKALVLMMATCILFAGCLEGAIEEIEDIIEEITPECDDSNALNYDENATNSKACISEEMLMDSIDVFAESMDSEDTMGGFVMTMSGDMSDLDEGMGMDSMEGGFTIVSTTASDSNTRYSSTDVKMNGMTVLSQSWMGKNTSTGEVSPVLMVIQADSPDGEFLMNSAMSWEDFLADADGQMSDDSDEEPDAAFYFLNIDTDSDNLVTWDEIENFVIEADGGWDSDEDRDEILELSSREDLFELMTRSIAPNIYATGKIPFVKRSLALQLFGGVPRRYSDGTRTRGDIHILMMGDPGVAKSQLLSFMGRISPRGRFTTGGGTTAAGLTAAAVRDAFNDGRFSLEAGALVLADMGLCAVDEFDKMSDADRGAMHEAMEQQVINISKVNEFFIRHVIIFYDIPRVAMY